ncbi:MAG: hypothetical protein OXI43_18320 [Candidatus Poribacteria bacterium]|nr:hypothetical protein [Candidatus Poribacteria bacterium]
MSKKMFWGLGALIVFVIAAGGFMYWQWSEMQQLKKEAAAVEKMWEEHEKAKQSAQPPIDYSKPPPGKTFANGGHWHNGEWHDGPHKTPVVVEDVPKTEPVQMESVVIEGVGDLKEWLTFFESFGDDPPLEKKYEFGPKRNQFYESLRDFDYKNASPEVLALLAQIREKNTALGYVFGKKSAIERAEADARRAEWARRYPRPEQISVGFDGEGGGE